MIVKEAVFIKSSEKVAQCPPEILPEIAFIGRSNVGKSSLINCLVARKNLAKTSQTPGKTRHINHFLINKNWFLVDLPGFGFAKTSKADRQDFEKMIADYFSQREQLACVCLLIDSRLEPQKIDIAFMNFLGKLGIPFVLIFTKIDKQSIVKTNKNVIQFQKTVLETWEEMPQFFLTSSETGIGKKEVLEFIDGVKDTFNNQ